MPWQKLLADILPDSLIKVDPHILDSVEEIKIASDNTTTKQTIINNGTLIIINGGENNEAAKILGKLSLEKLEKNDTVLETSSANTLKQIDSNFWSDDVQKKITQYDGMVPGKDYHALEAAIFAQFLYDQGQNIGEYIRDIAIRYGQRGSMICHLYSAGYFDTLIAPLYKELMQNDAPRVDEYSAVYELIVTESPLALFISRRDTVNNIKTKILNKIKINQSTSTYYLNIHGIGEENRSHMLSALNVEDIRGILVGESDISTKNGMTTITIYFSPAE